jgi:hypothetical protein
MLIAGSTPRHPIGARVEALSAERLFAQPASSYVLELSDSAAQHARATMAPYSGLVLERVARLDDSGSLSLSGASIGVEDLARDWLGPLDW